VAIEETVQEAVAPEVSVPIKGGEVAVVVQEVQTVLTVRVAREVADQEGTPIILTALADLEVEGHHPMQTPIGTRW